jgi:hypothetical protein
MWIPSSQCIPLLVHFFHPKHAPRATTHTLPHVWPNTLSRSSPDKPYVAGNKAPQCPLLLAPSAQIDLPAAPRLKRTWQPPPPAGHHDHTMQSCKPPWEFSLWGLYSTPNPTSKRTTCEDEDASHKRVKKNKRFAWRGWCGEWWPLTWCTGLGSLCLSCPSTAFDSIWTHFHFLSSSTTSPASDLLQLGCWSA